MEPDYEVKINELKDKYNQLLSKCNFHSIGNACRIMEERRHLVSRGIRVGKLDIDSYDEETQRVFRLLLEYQQEIKQFFINNGLSLAHISGIAPQDMRDGKIHRSRNCPNHYENEVGDWVFASSTPLDGRNPYIARCNEGMIRIGENAYIYGSDNFEVIQNENGENQLVLKKPNYVYELNPRSFTPVVSIERDKIARVGFDFSEEWVSDEDVELGDGCTVRSISEIRNITGILRFYHVFSDVNQNGIGMDVLRTRDRMWAFKIISQNYNSGNLRYLNNEVGINVSPLFRAAQWRAKKSNRDEDER